MTPAQSYKNIVGMLEEYVDLIPKNILLDVRNNVKCLTSGKKLRLSRVLKHIERFLLKTAAVLPSGVKFMWSNALTE